MNWIRAHIFLMYPIEQFHTKGILIVTIGVNIYLNSNGMFFLFILNSFGDWAIFERPLVLRPHLAVGLPLSGGARLPLHRTSIDERQPEL